MDIIDAKRLPLLRLPALAGATDSSELTRLIEAHRAAFEAFGLAIDREQEAKDLLRKGEPTVDSGLGKSFSLYMGEEECRRLIASEYREARWHLKRTRRMGVVIPPERDAVADAKEAEAMAAVDRAFAEYNAAEAACNGAAVAEERALLAICSSRCRSLEEARIKAEYLLTTTSVRDFWETPSTVLLRSFVEEVQP